MGTYHSYHNGQRPIANLFVENIIQSKNNDSKTKIKRESALALFDTGAMSSCISNELASLLGLKIVGKKSFKSVSGEIETYVYKVKILFPLNLNFTSQKDSEEVQVSPTEIVEIETLLMGVPIETQGIDLLIGMDLISKGNFYINKGFLSFEIPTSNVSSIYRLKDLFSNNKSVPSKSRILNSEQLDSKKK